MLFPCSKEMIGMCIFFCIFKSDWKIYSLQREPPTFGSPPSSEQQRTQESKDGNIHYQNRGFQKQNQSSILVNFANLIEVKISIKMFTIKCRFSTSSNQKWFSIVIFFSIINFNFQKLCTNLGLRVLILIRINSVQQCVK